MLYYRTGITYHSVTLQGIHMSRNCNVITPAKLKAVRALRGISQAELRSVSAFLLNRSSNPETLRGARRVCDLYDR